MDIKGVGVSLKNVKVENCRTLIYKIAVFWIHRKKKIIQNVKLNTIVCNFELNWMY